jgi:hypothetical protein
MNGSIIMMLMWYLGRLKCQKKNYIVAIYISGENFTKTGIMSLHFCTSLPPVDKERRYLVDRVLLDYKMNITAVYRAAIYKIFFTLAFKTEPKR